MLSMLLATAHQTLSPVDNFLNKALAIPIVQIILYVVLLSIIVGIPTIIVKSRKEKRMKQAKSQEFKAFRDFDAKKDGE